MVKDNNLHDITLALAGMIQSTSLASEFAQTGKLDDDAFQVCIHSIFQTNPRDVNEVFGGKEKLKIGLQKLVDLFNTTSLKTRSQMKYLVSLIQMQKKIMNNSRIQNDLQKRIDQAKKQAEYFSLTHPTVISNLADIYINAISTFNFRVLMWGHQRVLGVNENMEKIRALLLAGIRSTVLWRQVGGSRLHLLFSRSKMKDIAEKVLAEI